MEIRWLLQWLELTCTLRFRLVPEGTGSANKHEIERVHCRGALSASASGFTRLHDAPLALRFTIGSTGGARLWRGGGSEFFIFLHYYWKVLEPDELIVV